MTYAASANVHVLEISLVSWGAILDSGYGVRALSRLGPWPKWKPTFGGL